MVKCLEIFTYIELGHIIDLSSEVFLFNILIYTFSVNQLNYF